MNDDYLDPEDEKEPTIDFFLEHAVGRRLKKATTEEERKHCWQHANELASIERMVREEGWRFFWHRDDDGADGKSRWSVRLFGPDRVMWAKRNNITGLGIEGAAPALKPKARVIEAEIALEGYNKWYAWDEEEADRQLHGIMSELQKEEETGEPSKDPLVQSFKEKSAKMKEDAIKLGLFKDGQIHLRPKPKPDPRLN